MHEPHDEELILYYYGESRDAEAVRLRLAASAPLREHYDELCRVLKTMETLPVPEPPDDYGARIWQHLAPRLTEEPPSWSLFSWLSGILPAPQQLALAGGVAVLVVIAFFAGRFLPGSAPPELPAVTAERGAGERMFLVTVGRHLERSEMLLVELVNAENPAELDAELHLAADLISSNRLYRQAAHRSGEESVAKLLEELERLLLELAHSPENLSSEELASLRQRIDDDGMLFRVRILSARMERDNQHGNHPKPADHSPPGQPGEV